MLSLPRAGRSGSALLEDGAARRRVLVPGEIHVQMSAFFKFINSSIGKKMLMGVTGLMLCLFLVGHLAGNLLLYVGPDAFNAYAHTLQKNPVLVPIELGLLAVFLFHIFLAIRVTLDNRSARPVPYALDEAAGPGRSVASRTMIYSGLVMALFVPVHLINFKYGDIVGGDLYGLVVRTFQSPGWALFYVASMAVLANHLRHGFRSGFQSLGALCGKTDAPDRMLSVVFGVAIGGGFLLIPVWAFLFK